MVKKCGVCKVNDSKYKCPTCSVPFCSLPCSKEHKKTCGQEVAVKNESLVPEKSLQTKEDVVINSVHNEGKVAMVEDKNLVPDNERKEKKEPQEDKIEEKITWSKEEELQIDSETPDAAFLDDHGSYRIPFPVLKRLGESEELRRTLESVRLQEKIKGIPTTQNSAPYRLNEALMDPDFEDVVDLMLKIVGVRDEDGNSLIPQ